MENGKDKSTGGGRSSWSVMDTVILILLVAAILSFVGRVVYAYRLRGEDTKTTMYSVRFTVEDIHREALESVRAFDDVYLYDTGERLGNIGVYENKDGTQKVAFAAIPAGDSAETAATAGPNRVQDGEETVAETVPPHFTERTAAEGLMFCSGGELKDGCLLIGAGGLYIAPGTELKVCTERVVFTMRVTEIQPRT